MSENTILVDLLHQMQSIAGSRLTPEDEMLLKFIEKRLAWIASARPDQLPEISDESWRVWMMLGGRGSGKTRAGAEFCSWLAGSMPNTRIGIIAPTAGDLRRVIFEGESGLVANIPEDMIVAYNRSLFEMRLRNGSMLTGFSDTEPDRIRGNQFHFCWLDEIASYEKFEDTWSNINLANRLGKDPKVFISTTPRPLQFIRRLVKEPTTKVMKASTFDNAANLAKSAIENFQSRYEGTRLGLQELYGEILDDVDGSLVTSSMIMRPSEGAIAHPLCPEIMPGNFKRVVVAVDPSGSHKKTIGNDECGIVVAARFHEPGNQAVILEDLSGQLSPQEWAQRAIDAYYEWQADAIVIETNFGGEMAVNTIETLDANVRIEKVNASRGKNIRFEPVANLYSQHRIWHYKEMPILEQQLYLFTYDSYQGEKSPDRADALVWALTQLMLTGVDAPLVGATLMGGDVKRIEAGIGRWEKARALPGPEVPPPSRESRQHTGRAPLIGAILIGT